MNPIFLETIFNYKDQNFKAFQSESLLLQICFPIIQCQKSCINELGNCKNKLLQLFTLNPRLEINEIKIKKLIFRNFFIDSNKPQ